MNSFNIDFRSVNLLELRNRGILVKEIRKIFETENSKYHRFTDFLYVIGYLDKVKFLHIAYVISKSITFDIEVLQVGIPNEEDIKKYWCK